MQMAKKTVLGTLPIKESYPNTLMAGKTTYNPPLLRTDIVISVEPTKVKVLLLHYLALYSSERGKLSP